MLKHKVRITVGEKNPVIQSGQRTLRARLLDWVFGVKTGVFVLTPGRSVETVEIMELPEGGGISHEPRSSKTAG
jgi:hypothetical protein